MNLPRTKLIPNGDNIVHTFTDTEYKNRQARLRQHMAENNIDDAIQKSIELLEREDFKNYNIIDLRVDGKIIVE